MQLLDAVVEVVVFTLFTSIWNFIGVYLSGCILVMLHEVIKAKLKQKPLDLEETMKAASFSWIGVMAILAEYVADLFMAMGKKTTQVICKMVGVKTKNQ